MLHEIQAHDSEYLTHIFDWLCAKLNNLYGQYMETNDIVSKYSLGLPAPKVDVCRDLRHVIWMNHIGNSEILRIDLRTPLISLRAKCLYNRDASESFINLIDFSLNKIQLRSGGFGTKVINAVFDCHKKWMAEFHGVKVTSIEMGVFKFLSIPFWLKQEFSFRWMGELDEEANHQNVTYKFFKLLILMNQLQDLNQHIHNFELFSLEASQVDDMLRRQVLAYYNKTYNENLQIKANVLDYVGSRCCEDFETDNIAFCTKVTYKNICNQLVNEKLSENIIPILQELFYMTKTVGGDK